MLVRPRRIDPSGRFLLAMRKGFTMERRMFVAPTRSARPRVERTPWGGWTILVSGAALLAFWQVLVSVVKVPAWLLPSPLAVWGRFGQVVADGTLWSHLVPTVAESIGGFVVALVLGITAGYVIAHSPTLERWIAPYLAALQSIPVIAVAPLLIVWTPNGLVRNVLVAALVVFFPIFSGTVTGMRNIPRELREVARVEGATLWQRMHMVEFPLALPTIFSGIRTSLAYATTGAVVAEFVGTRYGLGAMINIARGLLDMPLLFVAIGCLVAITLVFYVLVAVAERALTGWQNV
jgi:NitT/TauT family transport system permease protein